MTLHINHRSFCRFTDPGKPGGGGVRSRLPGHVGSDRAPAALCRTPHHRTHSHAHLHLHRGARAEVPRGQLGHLVLVSIVVVDPHALT